VEKIMISLSDFEEYMCSTGFMEGSTKYQLYGVINHHGNVGGGHYTANAVSWSMVFMV